MFLRCALPATRLTPCSFVAYLVEFIPHFVPQAYALSSPSVILDVLNPKMFVKTCVFRHSFSCHFFFCVVFKEHFALVFSVWLRCCSETLVRVAYYAFLAFPSLRLAIRKIPSQNPSESLRSSTGRMYPSFRVPESLQENHLLRLSPQQK